MFMFFPLLCSKYSELLIAVLNVWNGIYSVIIFECLKQTECISWCIDTYLPPEKWKREIRGLQISQPKPYMNKTIKTNQNGSFYHILYLKLLEINIASYSLAIAIIPKIIYLDYTKEGDDQ